MARAERVESTPITSEYVGDYEFRIGRYTCFWHYDHNTARGEWKLYQASGADPDREYIAAFYEKERAIRAARIGMGLQSEDEE